MTAVFDTLRSLGMKAIVRYSYVQCQRPDGSFIFQEDAKKDQLLAHIGQVTPILKVKSRNKLANSYLRKRYNSPTEKHRRHLRPTSRLHRLLGRMVLHQKLRGTEQRLQAECDTEKGSRRNYEGLIKGRSRPDGSDADASLETGPSFFFCFLSKIFNRFLFCIHGVVKFATGFR